MNGGATLVMRSSVVYGLWLCLFAASIVSASFSNIHFEFNDAANFLNIDFHNEARVFAEFAQSVATRVQSEMVYDPKNRSMLCLPFNGTHTITQESGAQRRNFSFQCHDGFISHFRAVEVASPVSINKEKDFLYNVSVLFRFKRFAMSYHDLTLTVDNEKPKHTPACMIFSNDSYFRLNMSFDDDSVKSARLLSISLPHYCVYDFEMPKLAENDEYLILKMRPHFRHHFETVEKPRLIEFLYKFFKFIVETTWYGETYHFGRDKLNDTEELTACFTNVTPSTD